MQADVNVSVVPRNATLHDSESSGKRLHPLAQWLLKRQPGVDLVAFEFIQGCNGLSSRTRIAVANPSHDL